jgi:hypothetical protein
MILWILSCRVTAKADTLFPFYAKDREDAERQAEEILQNIPPMYGSTSKRTPLVLKSS